jgi:hypothetical protein
MKHLSKSNRIKTFYCRTKTGFPLEIVEIADNELALYFTNGLFQKKSLLW